jgi:CubicO group peptidase (beta-lactamase class C family)
MKTLRTLSYIILSLLFFSTALFSQEMVGDNYLNGQLPKIDYHLFNRSVNNYRLGDLNKMGSQELDFYNDYSTNASFNRKSPFAQELFITQNNKEQIHRLDNSKIRFSELDNRLLKLVDTAKVTGFTLTVFNHDTAVYQKAFGYSNNASKDSLKVDHVFYGASLSKSVFGYLVAQLVHERVIDLDKPLQDYLDEPIPEMKFEKEWRGFKNLASDDRYKEITARMCLSHTTGLPNWRWISRTNEFTPEGEIHFYFDPGSEYSYSGEGMMLLQYVIERITGKGLEQLARERVFEPLKMDMTSYIHQKRFESKYCNGHTTHEDVIKKDISDEFSAAGSLSTSPEDYSRFMEHILSLESRKSPITAYMFKPNIQIRSKKQFGAMSLQQTNDNDNINLSYGLGWGIFTTPYGPGYFKEGHGEGFQHYSVIFPDKNLGILIMANSDNAESIFKEVLEIGIGDVYTPWFWEDYIPYNKKPGN